MLKQLVFNAVSVVSSSSWVVNIFVLNTNRPSLSRSALDLCPPEALQSQIRWSGPGSPLRPWPPESYPANKHLSNHRVFMHIGE